MGDPVENNLVTPNPYASYEDADLGVSIAPESASTPAEPAVDLTTASTGTGSSDTFSRPLRLPRHLSPHDNIRISDGHGGSRTLEVIDLIREARTDVGVRRQLLTLASAAASDPTLLNRCYVSKEENLIPMLAQLGSSDPVARHEGALSLRYFILSHPEDRQLQQALIATVAEVAHQDQNNTDAREVLRSISNDSSPQNAGLRNWMQSQPRVATFISNEAVSQAGTNSNSNAAGSNAGGSNAAAIVGAPGTNGVSVSGDTKALANLATPAPLSAPVADQLLHLIESRVAGTPLEGVPTEGILSFAQNNAALPAQQFEDLLRLRILADALPLTGFTGNLFGSASTVAGVLAADIRRTLAREGGTAAISGEVLRPSTLAASVTSDGAPIPFTAPTVTTAAATVPSEALSGSFAGMGSNFLPGGIIPFFVPALLTSLSGMQGLSAQPNNLGPTPLATLAMGLAGNSTYHVEGPTTVDEDGHQSFGGGSQGHSGQGDDGEHRDERHEAPDSYLA
ncbi:MAG: hypothetical protein K8R69_00420 [Deltaproteobacteria bacterium]|nr:hypothetical protein [Deltaproteobacteria bacterium]